MYSPFSSAIAGPRMTHALTPTSDETEARRLVERFETAVTCPSGQAMLSLRTSTRALAASMRSAHLRPELAVVTLKSLLRGHGAVGWSPSLAPERFGASERLETPVYGALFAWWVAAFFDDGSG